MDALLMLGKRMLSHNEPPIWVVRIVAIVLLISGTGTFYYWASMMMGNVLCIECVPFGLSTFRFLHWPIGDLVLDALCFTTAYGLLRRSRFVYLSAVTLGFLFIAMAILAVYMDLFVRDHSLQPLFLNVWFVGWGTFMLWFMHHWRQYWTTTPSALPTQRKTGAI